MNSNTKNYPSRLGAAKPRLNSRPFLFTVEVNRDFDLDFRWYMEECCKKRLSWNMFHAHSLSSTMVTFFLHLAKEASLVFLSGKSINMHGYVMTSGIFQLLLNNKIKIACTNLTSSPGKPVSLAEKQGTFFSQKELPWFILMFNSYFKNKKKWTKVFRGSHNIIEIRKF